MQIQREGNCINEKTCDKDPAANANHKDFSFILVLLEFGRNSMYIRGRCHRKVSNIPIALCNVAVASHSYMVIDFISII